MANLGRTFLYLSVVKIVIKCFLICFMRIEIRTFISTVLVVCSNLLFCQPPSIQWQKCLGGSTIDEGFSVRQILDGGYIIAGYTQSNNGDVSGLHNNMSNFPDFWVTRLDYNGIIKWQKCLGGSINDLAYSVKQTLDGGFIIAGESNSNDGNVSGNHGLKDSWIIKLDSTGTIKWQKSLGGSVSDWTESIQLTNDKGFILAGTSSSNNGDVTGNHGNSDCWIVKLDSSGIIEWQKSYGSIDYESAYSIQQTTDKGYIFLGTSGAIGGDVTFNHGNADFWVVKLDSLGNLVWQKSLGGSDSEVGSDIFQTTDKGYIAVGHTQSYDGDVSANHPGGSTDYWIVKLDSLGIITWEKCLGGSMNDFATSVEQCTDGSYVILGHTMSNDGDITGNHAGVDGWLTKLSSTGSLIWQKCFGGTGNDYLRELHQTSGGGAVLIGTTNSNDGDVVGNHGGDDFWVVKLGNINAITESFTRNDLRIYPNPSSKLIWVKNSDEIDEISITDLQGVILQTTYPKTSFFKIEINIPGFYFVSVKSGNQIYTRKVVVN